MKYTLLISDDETIFPRMPPQEQTEGGEGDSALRIETKNGKRRKP